LLTGADNGEPILNPGQMSLHGGNTFEGFHCISPGHFAWSGPLGDWVFYLVKDEYQSVRRDVTLHEDGETVRLVIALERGLTIHGRVRSKDDVPLVSGNVFFISTDDAAATVTCAIAGDGTYRGSGFVTGKRYRPEIAGAFADGRRAWWVVAGGGELTIAGDLPDVAHDLVVTPAGVVVVWVKSPRLPVPGARLEVNDVRGVPVRTFTRLGEHEINVIVPEGEYTLRLTIPGAAVQEHRLMLASGLENIPYWTFVVP
jgi:hypothetical protein